MSDKPFNFEKARRVTPAETERYRKAIEAKLGVKRARRGRPPLADDERAQPVSIRLSPAVIAWAKRKAKKEGIGYQTVIKRALDELAEG